jgi:hypothetical protein
VSVFADSFSFWRVAPVAVAWDIEQAARLARKLRYSEAGGGRTPVPFMVLQKQR